jgi:intracellular sulfur oxidation DsrE/DsrF family protein
MIMFARPLVFALAWLLAGLAPAQAGDRGKIAALLERESAPPGVVIEVIAGRDALDWVVPRIADYVSQLRSRWPELEIAVVSHGREQFALTQEQAGTRKAVHRGVQSLVSERNVPVYVCETHASWQGVTPEDFPDCVNVTPTGPAQVNNYRALGFELVVIRGR